jgi:dTDP-4-amino-4,6-dideoxygalactose transaminase
MHINLIRSDNLVKEILIKTFTDKRGKLSVVELSKECGFTVKRIYYLYDFKKTIRGSHAHKNLKQCIICLNGSAKIYFHKGDKNQKVYHLNKPNKAILVHGCIWKDIEEIKKNTILLVLASEKYQKNDYLRSKKDFENHINYKIKRPVITHHCIERMHNKLIGEFNEKFDRVLKSNNFILGNEVKKFEKNFANFSKAKYSISCGNGFDALVLALRSLNISKSDEVIIPANSFVATAMAVSIVGAIPVFVDCNYEDYSINLIDLQKKITKKTKAIIPVSLYGIPLDIEKINNLASKYKLKVIEDASQAHGVSFFSNNKFLEKKFLNWKLATFSFYPTKNLGALGDGGAILTNDKNLYNKIKLLRNYGSLKKYDHRLIGFNSRLDEVQAAFLNVKLKYLKKWILHKRKIAKIYIKELSDIKHIGLLSKTIIEKSVFYVFPIKIFNNQRARFIEFLKKSKIETNIHYPVSIQNQYAYRSFKNKIKNCDKIAKEIVSLPIGSFHTEDEIFYICKKIKEFFK